jgi:peroxiredoxin
MDNRSLFVIGTDGRIAYVAKPFNAFSANAYTELGNVVDRLTKAMPGEGTP